MLFGSIAFTGSIAELRKVADMVESDLLTANVNEIEGPIDIEFDQDGILYQVGFNSDQWINVPELKEQLASLDSIDIIHALTDGETFIEVVSTNTDYDNYEDTDYDKLEDMSRLYHVAFKTNTVIEDDEEEESLDDEDEYNWD